MTNEPKNIADLTPEIMNLLGELLKNTLPTGMGFSLVVFDFGEGLREFKYVSNAQRKDMIATLESLVASWKYEEGLNQN